MGIKRYSKWIVLLVCISLFLFILIAMIFQKIVFLDVTGYDLVSKLLISEKMTPKVIAITKMGGALIIILLVAILFFVIKKKKIWFSIIANLGTITLLNLILKNILQRPRPIDYRLIEESGYSFPSGHSMIGMAFYGYLIYLIYKYFKNKYLKWLSIIVISLLISLIGISRIYLGVHYTSDVLGGFLFSIAYLIIFIEFIDKFLLEDDKMEKKIKQRTKNLINSFKYAFDGIISSFKSERNMKIHVLIMTLVIIFGIICHINLFEWIICVLCFGIVIGAELFNTAIETTVNLAMPDRNNMAKLAKDISAGAVLVTAICSAIVGLIIFIPKILLLIS